MAIVRKNLIVKGLSGMLGDTIVFRSRGGETVVSSAPERKDQEPSQKQREQQLRFQQAVVYGKAVNADPVKKKAYGDVAKANQSAYNVAFADFLNAPSIEEVDLSAYDGKVGSKIRIRCIDDFKVNAVIIKIQNADGSIADEGNAMIEANGLDWIFTATKVNATLAGDKITVTVTDLPNNVVSVNQTL